MLACHASPFTKHFARTRQAPSDSRWTASNSHRPPAVSARALVIRRGGPSLSEAHDPASGRQFPTNSGVGSARGLTTGVVGGGLRGGMGMGGGRGPGLSLDSWNGGNAGALSGGGTRGLFDTSFGASRESLAGPSGRGSCCLIEESFDGRS